MSTTPRGMRTFLTASPIGRRQVAVTSPTGSGSAATSVSALAMPSSRFGSSARRSRKAARWPALRAAATSARFSERIRRARFPSAAAAARSASSFCAVGAWESARAASFAATASCLISPWSVSLACRISLLRPRLEQDHVVPVDDLVEVLIPERPLDLARLQPGDAAHLVRAVPGEPAGEGPPLVHGDVHRIADAELARHRPHARREEAPPLVDERLAGARVHQDDALPLRGRGEPALAPCEPLRLGREVGADPRSGEERGERARATPGEERRPHPLRGEPL